MDQDLEAYISLTGLYFYFLRETSFLFFLFCRAYVIMLTQ